MYSEAEQLNEIYTYIMVALGMLSIVAVFATVMLMKNFQHKVVKMNNSKNQFIRNLSTANGPEPESVYQSEQLMMTRRDSIYDEPWKLKFC